MKHTSDYSEELEDIWRKVAKDKALFHEFLLDLLSPAERKEFGLRLQIVKLLHNNTPHREIARQLKTSITTVTRGSRELQNKNGGFAKILKKYYGSKKTSNKQRVTSN